MNRVRWYFDQLVTDGELNLAFDQAEQADRDLASDLGLQGIISGAIAVPHQPVPDLSVDLTAPGRAYDRSGRRVFLPAQVTVNLAVDSTGVPTDVAGPGQERWVSVFLRFVRVEHDPRTDGNSQQVNFRRDEAAEVVVRQGAEGPASAAPRPPLDPTAVLICDVARRPGQTQVVVGDIDITRRQDFVLAGADAIGVQPALWHTLAPSAPTVQASFDATDAVLTEHIGGAARRHQAAHVEAAPPGFLTATHVQGLLAELVAVLVSTAAGTPGAARIGADAVVASPHALAPGTVDGQLQQLLGHLNAHSAQPAGAHAASAIAATPHAYVQAASVQGQLQEIVVDLATTAAGFSGARRIGVEPIAGSPVAMTGGAVQDSLGFLLGALNSHLATPLNAHPAAAVAVADTSNRYTAGTVEAGLQEVMTAFEAQHVRPNQDPSTAGWHRTIRQGVIALGATSLLWESFGAGASSTFRVLALRDGVMFTINAAWTGSAWQKDITALPSVGMQLTQDIFQLLFHTGASPFTGWPRLWRIILAGTAGSSGWEVFGQIEERGRLSCEATNTATVGRTVTMGSTVNLRSRLLQPPSSVTLLAIETSAGFVGTPTITNIDRDGFVIQSSQFLAASAHGRWVGRYTVTA